MRPRSLVAAALLLALPDPCRAQPATLAPAYLAAVARYAAGEREGAIADVTALTERELREQLEALRSLSKRARACGACADAAAWRETPLPAALMLHTDTSLRREADGPRARLHESIATGLAQLMKDDPERRGFAQRWYAVMAGLAQSENGWDEALAWVRRGLDAFPDSAELLLALASIEESMSRLAAPRTAAELLDPTPGQPSRNPELFRDARQGLQRARRDLRAALAADPSLDEARLRLGRVAWWLGEPAEARAALDELLARAPAPGTAYLAHLFSGRLQEDAGRLDQALRSYEAALALEARGQAARLALSHARLRLGDTAAARREAETALAAAGQRRSPDPFWVYAAGAAADVEERLESLRREAGS